MTPDASPNASTLAQSVSGLPPPIIIYNKSHSGSRLLAGLLESGGIFLGSHLNESRDSLDVLRLVEWLVTRHYPDYGPLWEDPSEIAALAEVSRSVFASHTAGRAYGQPWGWKLCETSHILPVVDRLFPGAKYIHLVRDGRDVAFSDHQAPNTPFWRKIYFDTDRIRWWEGDRLKKEQYVRRPHVYNALHWVNSVRVGRTYGAMLRERLLEIRYEALCQSFETVAEKALRFAGVAEPAPAIRSIAPSVKTASIGKFRAAPAAAQREVLAIEKPLLLSLGYLTEDPERAARAGRSPTPWWRPWRGRA